MSKIKCPNCNSTNLRYFEEEITPIYYKLDTKNEPTEKVISKGCPDIGAYGYICNKCEYRFGGSMFSKDE